MSKECVVVFLIVSLIFVASNALFSSRKVKEAFDEDANEQIQRKSGRRTTFKEARDSFYRSLNWPTITSCSNIRLLGEK